ncbi:hypothetical protein UG53_02595, partial [Vibrio sp. S512-13]
KNPCIVLAIIGKPRDQQAIQTRKELYEWLSSGGYKVFIDDRLAAILDEIPQNLFASLVELGKNEDLAIVVGGDGKMLGAARILLRFDVPVIGVNPVSYTQLTLPNTLPVFTFRVCPSCYKNSHCNNNCV